MAVYTIATISLILLILEITDNCPNGISKAAAYADDFTATRTVKGPLFKLPDDKRSISRIVASLNILVDDVINQFYYEH